MKTIFLLSLFVVLSGCSTASVRQSDLNSWKGQSISVLEQHPVFSALPREEREISEADTRLINYSQKAMIEDSSTCVSTGFGMRNFGFGSGVCSPRVIEKVACVHQFLIKNNHVESYRVLGEDCYTDCKMRPAHSGNCKD